jgi:hypothetical protein
VTVPVQLLQVGLALETSYGVGVAPVTSLKWTQCQATDSNPLGKDQSWRGSAADCYDHEAGVLASAAQLAGPVFADSIGYLLAGILGDYVFTAGTPNSHVFALGNAGTQQPPAYTLTTREPVGGLQRAGCKLSDLTFDIDAENPLQYQAALVGLASTTTANTPPAVSTEKLLPSWTVAATIGGSSEPRLMSASVVFARPVDTKRNSDGTQAPWLQRSGPLAVTGDVELAITTDAYRAGFLASTTTSIDLNYQAGAGATLRQLKLHCSQVAITDLTRDYGGKWVALKFSWEAEANTSDAGVSGGKSPIKVTLKNQVGSGVYQ